MPEDIERSKGLVSAGEIINHLKTLAELPPEDLEIAIKGLDPREREEIKQLLPVLNNLFGEERK